MGTCCSTKVVEKKAAAREREEERKHHTIDHRKSFRVVGYITRRGTPEGALNYHVLLSSRFMRW